MAVADMLYSTAFFSGIYDNVPDECPLTWEKLAAGLSESRQLDRKEGRLWSPVSYMKGTSRRVSEFVHSVSCLVLDFDSGTDPSDFMDSWAHLSYVVHSTYSSTAEHPKWRAVFPLSGAVPAADWPKTYEKMAMALGHGAADPACSDLARMYFLPSHPKGSEPFYFRNDAIPLDPNSIPDVEDSVTEEIRAYSGKIRPGDDFERQQDWEGILERHGWRKFRLLYKGQTLWTRPGKKSGTSAKTGPGPYGDRFYCWSSEAGVPCGKALTKFALLAHLDHGGDYKACADALRSKGYGASQNAPSTVADIDGKPMRFHLTDLGNAERMAATYGADLRYVSLWGRWTVWDSRRWEIDETGGSLAQQMAHETVRSMQRQAADLSDPDERKALGEWAFKCESRSRIDNMASICKSLKGVPATPKDFDVQPNLLNLRNGTMDLKTGEIRPHSKADYLTRLIDIPYTKEAECPIWIEFLLRCMDGDEALVDFLWRALGYSLTGDTSAQCFFFLHGSQGNNGKSTFIETILSILGDYAMQTPTETLMARKGDPGISNDVARLKEARFVAAPETEDGSRLNEGLIKRLTGGDTITARYLHQEFFEFKPQFKIWMTGNHKPVVRGTDDAIWRRVTLIPFQVVIPESERDPDLKEKLYAEREGILGWMVDGCLEWRKRGLRKPDSIAEAVTHYRSEMDTLGAFLDECTTKTISGEVKSGTLYAKYQEWCKASGEFCLAQQRFGRTMVERGFQSAKRGSYFWYRGLELSDDDGISGVYRGGE